MLTRGPYTAPWQTVHWDGDDTGPWAEYLEGADVCINLAGRSVNCRYNSENRQAIYDSRIDTTQLLGRVIAGWPSRRELWMNASAATIYKRALDADGVDLPLDEVTGELGGDEFSAKTPEESGGAAGIFPSASQETGRRRSLPRRRRARARWPCAARVVLSPTPGSAFAVLSNLVRAGLGGKQGNGRQFVSWIHEADYARAVEFLIDHEELTGPVNMAAPNPLPNREFMAALR